MWVRPHYVWLIDSVYTLLSFLFLFLFLFCFFKRMYIPMQFWVLCSCELPWNRYYCLADNHWLIYVLLCSLLFLFTPRIFCYLSEDFYASKCTKMFELSTWWLYILLYWIIYFILLGYNDHESFLNGLSKVQY